ncbi:MAG: DUF1016 family protein [Chloroflexi bacterium]|nr:DUF1016 family protein [Chloroflexota bacterium]
MDQTSFRGKTFTHDDVLNAMERFDREFRASFPEKRWVTYAIKCNAKIYPPKQIMRLVTGLNDLGSGGRPVNSRFEDLGFTIVILDENESITPDGGQVEDAETEIAFSLEYDLENSLVANLSQIEKGLRLYKERGIVGQQVDAQAAGRIDLLAIDANNDLVVIELKAGEADRQVCGQIQAYMGWVKENLAGEKKVRGIIIANDFTARATYAAKVVPDLNLKKYNISFKFTDM